MCLRITDNLFEKLLTHFDFLDKSSSFDLENRAYLKKLVDFCENTCKITSPFYYNKNEKRVTIRSLKQNERLKILKNLEKKNLLDLFPDLSNDNNTLLINFILIEFYKLFEFVKKDHSDFFDKEKLVYDLKNWLQMYLKVNENKITPYIHVFTTHTVSFIEEFKNLSLFSTQALENLNKIHKINYFKQTNKKKDLFLVQLLEKINRLEFIHLGGTVDEIYAKLNNF
jgi:hypothetical protein